MAEAFAILGIAANIAQFVSFGIQLISEAKKIHGSFHGVQNDHHELEVIVEDIKKSCKDVVPAPGSLRDAQAFQQLLKECIPLADKLLFIRSDRQVSKAQNHRGLEVVRQTLRSVAKRKEIQELKRRLLDMDQRLRARAFSILQEYVSFDFRASNHNAGADN